ncbi:MAG: hypothetical protein OEY01_14670 [Desulfobulbaceae bacterium]|nr:hypothetical protein [Desulfobulbaceae bacterium]
MYIEPFRAAVLASIKTQMGSAVKDCDTHQGRFNLDELKRLSVKAPAMRVAILGVPKISSTNAAKRDLVMPMACFVITRDAKQLPRDVAMLNLVETLLIHIDSNTWGLDYAKKPLELRGENLFSGAVAKGGIDLWAVTWKQTLRIPADGIAPNDPDLTAIGLAYYLQDPVDDDVADASDELTLA